MDVPPGNAPDPFVTDAAPDTSSAYDPTKFYTAARDKKGFATTARVNLPPSVLGQISALVAKQTIPEFRTTSDVIRDAVVHRLVWLGENMDSIEATAASRMLIAESRSEAYMRHRESIKRTLGNYQDSLLMAGRGDQNVIVAAMKQDLKGSTDDTFTEGLKALISKYE